MTDVPCILSGNGQGDPSAAEQLVPLVCDELRKLAAQKAHEAPGQTLQAAPVHEASGRPVNVEKARHCGSRGHFFTAATEAIQRILAERARQETRVNGRRIGMALLGLCFAACAASSLRAQSIEIGEAELLYTEDEIPIRYDSSLSTIRQDPQTMHFFHSFGCRLKSAGARRSRHSWHRGTPTDPFQVHLMSKREEELWDDNGYYDDTHDEGIWIVGMLELSEGDLLAITHSEYSFSPDERRLSYALGLGYSTDQGRSWAFCGEIVRAADRHRNVGGGAYLIAKDFLFVYYNDTSGPCVARAKLADVVRDARNRRVGPWHKYREGKWDTPGLSDVSGSNVIPRESGREDVHSDAAYCSALDKYLLTVQTHQSGRLLLFSSADGIQWSLEAVVDQAEDEVMQPYSTFVDFDGPANDCHVVDDEFYIYYPHKRLSNQNHDTMYRRSVKIVAEK